MVDEHLTIQPAVYLTVDVECSMGGAWGDSSLSPVSPERAVWGRYERDEYGIGRIADILERYGLSATFFVEVFLEEQGYPGTAQAICEYLLRRGQDVQLHIHPGHPFYRLHKQGKPHPSTDQMADLPPEQQLELLREGSDRLLAWTGKRPVAFRAGNLGASEETLRQLAAAGIYIDSSYSFPFVGGQCRFSDRDAYNGSRWYGEVLEMAFSGFYQRGIPGMGKTKVLDPMGISYKECRRGIRQIRDAGADAVLILHSFSLFKVRNKQYEGGKPNRIVERRFARLCQWLGEREGGISTRTFSELAAVVKAGRYQAKAVKPGTLPACGAVLRKLVQGYNAFYRT